MAGLPWGAERQQPGSRQKAEVDATNGASIVTRLRCCDDLVASQTVKIILAPVNRRGRSSA
jgi:hypothetical protein